MNNKMNNNLHLPHQDSSLISSEISSILPLDFSIKHILRCPNCHIRIPLITKIVNDGELKIVFQCQCSVEVNEMPLISYFAFLNKLTDSNKPNSHCLKHNNALSNHSYCADCDMWLCEICMQDHQSRVGNHFVTNNALSLFNQCSIHQDKRLSHYCPKCSMELCESCVTNYHLNHKAVRLSQYIEDRVNKVQFQTETDLFYHFNKKIAHYTHIKDKRIDEVKAINNQLNALIKEIEEEHKRNLIKNIYLLGLIEIVYSQVFNEDRIPNVNAMTNLFYFQNAFDIKTMDMSTYDHIQKSINENIGKLKQEINEVLNRDIFMSEYQEAKFDAKELTLNGHTDWVKCLVQISDNQVASCSYDKTIKVWNLTQEKCTRTLKGHRDWIRKIIYLDKNIIASCSDDTTIKVWNVSLDEHIVSVQAHNKAVYNIIKLKQNNNNANGVNSISNVSIVVSASEDLTIKIWNVMKKELLFVLEGHSSIVSALDQLVDGRIVSGSWDKTIRIWNLNKSNCDSILCGHLKYIHCVIAIAPETIASCSEDKSIKIWNSKTSTCIKTLIGHSDGVLHLIKLQDGRLVSCSLDRTIKFWNATKETALSSITAHNYAVRYIIQLKDWKIVSCSDDLSVKVWY